ncbi:MAG TPA: selenocysteine-specific translation elongation factor [Patescibacteria group bacterium]|nr:selenocysteine-specific translation elongation factor [Patescibacteria group bacterium]
MSASSPLVVGTAGHIDHGKSLLVRALTGIDPDRLKEEQERGITIDLGFAHLTLADGTRVGFVDVPGHERFVRNMLAGVGGIDLVLLVIAADESIKPQTREHFDICRLLRVPRGIVVLTKSDLVEQEILDLVRLEVRELVAGSFLESSPVVAVSGRTGAGLEDLKRALAEAAARLPGRASDGLPRLPIDRAFSIRGFGTVVTGTLIAGTLHEGDEVVLLPSELATRVRGLEVHGRPTPIATPGQRVAANLQSVEAGAIARGDLLTVPGVLEPSRIFDVEIEYLPTAGGPLKDLSRVGFHLMTSETPARVKLVGGGSIPPGATAFAQLRTERPVTAIPGDRFILRRQSPPMTIAGGTLLHNAPPKLRRMAPETRRRYEQLASPDPASRLRWLIEEAGPAGCDAAFLRSRTGVVFAASSAPIASLVRDGVILALPTMPPRYVARGEIDGLRRAVVGALETFHRKEPLREGLAREEIRARIFADSHPDVFKNLMTAMVADGTLRLERDRAALASHRISLSAEDHALLDRLEKAYRDAGTNPPELAEATKAVGIAALKVEKLLHLLLSRGRLVRIPDGKVFHAEAIEDLKRRLWSRGAAQDSIDIAAFKELSGTSRKNAIPLLEYLDQVRVTRREGDRRRILPPPRPAEPAD